MNFKSEEHENIYEKLSSILHIKFKSQIQNGPIEFYKLVRFENLISNGMYYVLFMMQNQKQYLLKTKLNSNQSLSGI